MISNLLLIIFAFLLVLLNGFFVAAEFGLVKLRPTRVRAIAKTYGWRGKLLAKVHVQLDAYLSACQLGITLASLGLGWIGEPAFAELIEPFLALIGVDDPELISGIAFFIAFFIISFLHIVVGELVPKTLAIRSAETVGLWTAPALFGFYWLMYPAIRLLNQSSNLIIHGLKLGDIPKHESHYSKEELKLILRSSRTSDQFSTAEWRILAQAIDFRDLDVEDLMRPFSEAIVLSENDTVESNLLKMVQNRYSRYPYANKSDEIIGIIHIKDVFLAQNKTNLGDSLTSLARPIEIVLPDRPATDVFRTFQLGAPHMAIVGWSKSDPVGFVTLDNVLSALVGEIKDEFRQSHNEWTRLDDGSLLGKGSLPIPTLERTLGIDIESEQADTVAGLLLWKLADLPEEGQKVSFSQFDVVVKKMIGPRILLVRVYLKQEKA
jgi:CBS domain containing-hemolysin-like protein